jgi:uncharacterized protein (TIGR04255 family)
VFSLDEAPRYRLERAPLAQALAQVRFPLVAAFETLTGIAALQDQLIETFPYMEQKYVQGIGLLVGPGGIAASEGQSNMNWEFTDDEGRLLVIAPGSATLSVGDQYKGVEEFAERFSKVVGALGHDKRLRRIDRLGVRYLSLAEQPLGDEQAWTRWFRPEIVGWAGSDVVSGSALISSLTQIQLAAPSADASLQELGDVQGLVRHGLVPAGAVIEGMPPKEVGQLSYLLDFDMSVNTPQAFDPKSVSNQFRALHTQIDRFFCWALTDDGRIHFGYQEV